MVEGLKEALQYITGLKAKSMEAYLGGRRKDTWI